MGKNKIIKSLGKRIGNLVVHRILLRHTNKPESLNHLESEVDTYRDSILESSQEFNWNNQDKLKIKSLASKEFKKRIIKFYSDVKFQPEEVNILIDETIEECLF